MSKELLPLPEQKVWKYRTTGYTADQMREYALACIEAAKPAETCNYPDCKCPTENPCLKGLPADALGSLPVVAWMHLQREYSEPMPRRLDQDELNRGWTEYPLTDHAKATAEIARLHALSKEYFDKMNSWREAYKQVSKDCQNLTEKVIPNIKAKLAGVDALVETMKVVLRISDRKHDAWDRANELIDTYEAAQGKTPPPEQA